MDEEMAMPLRVIVTGGRAFNDKALVVKSLGELHAEHQIGVLVHGGATGADSHAKDWAIDNHVATEEFAANWEKYGKAAGPIRNQQMVDAGADLVVAFPGGRGTQDMMRRARLAGIKVLECAGGMET